MNSLRCIPKHRCLFGEVTQHKPPKLQYLVIIQVVRLAGAPELTSGLWVGNLDHCGQPCERVAGLAGRLAGLKHLQRLLHGLDAAQKTGLGFACHGIRLSLSCR